MKDVLKLIVHRLTVYLKLLRPGGYKSIVAEDLVLKQQLIILNRGRKRVPNLTAYDRLLFGGFTHLIVLQRLSKIAVVLKPGFDHHRNENCHFKRKSLIYFKRKYKDHGY